MDDEVTHSNVPMDRLTRLAAQMTQVLEEDENGDVQAIVFLTDRVKGGIQIDGYDDAMDAMVDLFVHMKAVFKAHGKELGVVGIPDWPEGGMN